MRPTWQRIENWLANSAPKALATLNPPATLETIREIEQAVNAALPDDFRESLLIHDGEGPTLQVFGPWELLASDRLLHRWKLTTRIDAEVGHSGPIEAEGPARAVWWNRLWVPFANDGAGNDLCLDLDPAENGLRGQVVEYVRDDHVRRVVTSSFLAWLTSVADDLEGGRYEVDAFLGFPIRRE